jgi:hypothetical protein
MGERHTNANPQFIRPSREWQTLDALVARPVQVACNVTFPPVSWNVTFPLCVSQRHLSPTVSCSGSLSPSVSCNVTLCVLQRLISHSIPCSIYLPPPICLSILLSLPPCSPPSLCGLPHVIPGLLQTFIVYHKQADRG